MAGLKLTLIGQGDAIEALPFVKSVMGHWPAGDRPAIHSVDLETLLSDPACLRLSRAVWVVLTEPASDSLLDRIAGLLYDADLPAVLTVPGQPLVAGDEFDVGIAYVPPGSDPLLVCGMLRTLWSVSSKYDALKTEMRFLSAHQGGLCDQIDKMDEELRLAAQLQKEFLPARLPQAPGFDFQVLFRPAGYVSGDIYDIEKLDDTHIGLFLGDAVGHGVPAALMTIYIKRSMYTKVIDPTQEAGYRIVSPDEALGDLNRDMCNRSNANIRFATAGYGVINLETRELQFARAGHPFPIILHADGSQSTLEPDGAMLGIFPEEVYELATVTLKEGDRLLLYSDGFELGFPDADPGHAQGQAQGLANRHYEEEFARLSEGSLRDGLDRLAAKLDYQIGSLNQRDDMTIVSMAVTGDSDPASLGEPPTPIVRAMAG